MDIREQDIDSYRASPHITSVTHGTFPPFSEIRQPWELANDRRARCDTDDFEATASVCGGYYDVHGWQCCCGQARGWLLSAGYVGADCGIKEAILERCRDSIALGHKLEVCSAR